MLFRPALMATAALILLITTFAEGLLVNNPKAMVAMKIDTLVDRCLSLAESNCHQVFIAIAGGPGSGKSTLARLVCDKLNGSHQDDSAVVIPMDGYHIPRAELEKMASSQEESYQDLLARRGDPDTFMPAQFARDLKVAKEKKRGSFPIYDRSISDPVPNGVQFNEKHKIILCEGLYLLSLDDDDWKPFSDLWDDRWLLNVPKSILRSRLVKRHLENWSDQKVAVWGPGIKGAEKKTDTADLPRSQFITDNSRAHCDLVFSDFSE